MLRLLIPTQLAFNVGFFAVLPFLAEHLGTAMGTASWLVGLVLRIFSRQGYTAAIRGRPQPSRELNGVHVRLVKGGRSDQVGRGSGAYAG
jgi:hypothetical protein